MEKQISTGWDTLNLNKTNMKKFIALAELLFTLEIESIINNPEGHFCDLGNDWFEKFGEKSIQFADKFITKDEDVKELAKILKTDFDNGAFVADKDGSLYNYEMPNDYGGFIVRKLEEQLGDFTGVGTQMEIFV